MLNLQDRLNLLGELFTYLNRNDEELNEVKDRAYNANGWFTIPFIELATDNIKQNFLEQKKLTDWAESYEVNKAVNPKLVGIVMAGNIPLVGFHDFLSVFVSGHRQKIKLSSKDEILLKHIIHKLTEWEPEVANYISIDTFLKHCDAYIATGSDNSANYFNYYFGKCPAIIRKNRTSVAVLDGTETEQALSLLADDVHQYFGLGCRNVTKLYVPENYDFLPLLNIFKKYEYLGDNHKFKNNYDYNLAIHLVNQQYYMTNGTIVLSENSSIFSPIAQLNYEFYSGTLDTAISADNLQCVTGKGYTPFGQAQKPTLTDYADGVDTMQFLVNL